MDAYEIEMTTLRERVVRLEEKIISADRALTLAEGKVSRAALISTITIIIAIVALAIQFVKR